MMQPRRQPTRHRSRRSLNLAATVLGNASAPDNALLAACSVVDQADATQIINSDRAWMLNRARQVRAGIEGKVA